MFTRSNCVVGCLDQRFLMSEVAGLNHIETTCFADLNIEKKTIDGPAERGGA